MILDDWRREDRDGLVATSMRVRWSAGDAAHAPSRCRRSSPGPEGDASPFVAALLLLGDGGARGRRGRRPRLPAAAARPGPVRERDLQRVGPAPARGGPRRRRRDPRATRAGHRRRRPDVARARLPVLRRDRARRRSADDARPLARPRAAAQPRHRGRRGTGVPRRGRPRRASARRGRHRPARRGRPARGLPRQPRRRPRRPRPGAGGRRRPGGGPVVGLRALVRAVRVLARARRVLQQRVGARRARLLRARADGEGGRDRDPASRPAAASEGLLLRGPPGQLRPLRQVRDHDVRARGGRRPGARDGVPARSTSTSSASSDPPRSASRHEWADILLALGTTGTQGELRRAMEHALRRAARPGPERRLRFAREWLRGERPVADPGWRDARAGVPVGRPGTRGDAAQPRAARRAAVAQRADAAGRADARRRHADGGAAPAQRRPPRAPPPLRRRRARRPASRPGRSEGCSPDGVPLRLDARGLPVHPPLRRAREPRPAWVLAPLAFAGVPPAARLRGVVARVRDLARPRPARRPAPPSPGTCTPTRARAASRCCSPTTPSCPTACSPPGRGGRRPRLRRTRRPRLPRRRPPRSRRRATCRGRTATGWRAASSGDASAAARTPPTGRVLATWAGVSHARRAVAMPQRTMSSVLTPCASESTRIITPASAAARAWTSLRSRRSPAELISSIVPVARGRLDQLVDVERVGLARLDLAARSGGRSRRRSGCSQAATIRAVISFSAMPKEVWTEAIDPVELGEQVVVVVERRRRGGC